MSTWIVAPNGTPGGAGTLASPWDFTTACAGAGGAILPGDTVYLRGGTYLGRWIWNVAGTPTSKITIRSYPGEWAKLNGYWRGTLAAPLGPSGGPVVIEPTAQMPETAIIQVGLENISVSNRSGSQWNTVTRGFQSTGARNHAVGAHVNLTDNILKANRADCIFRDFEIFSSDTRRELGPGPDRGIALWVAGDDVDCINLLLHDGSPNGIFQAGNSTGSVIYGCLIFNNGYYSPFDQLGHGHGIYGQNALGSPQKVIRHTIIFHSYNTGFKLESQSADTVNFLVDECVSFNSGAPLGLGSRTPACLVGANAGTTDDNEITNSVFYTSPGLSGQTAIFGFTGLQNGRFLITGNWILGGGQAVATRFSDDITFTGNLVSIGGLLASGQEAFGGEITVMRHYATAVEVWDNNEYYGRQAGGAHGFFWGTTGGSLGAAQSFTTWKTNSGFDASSTHDPNRATGSRVRVWPNQYQAGRGIITVLNFDQAATVAVDLTPLGIAEGALYQIREVQHLFRGAVFHGKYSAASPVIALPMNTLPATAIPPIGSSISLPSALPRFGCFLALPIGPRPRTMNARPAAGPRSAASPRPAAGPRPISGGVMN